MSKQARRVTTPSLTAVKKRWKEQLAHRTPNLSRIDKTSERRASPRYGRDLEDAIIPEDLNALLVSHSVRLAQPYEVES